MEFNFNLFHLYAINLLSFPNDLDERSKYIESSTQTFLSGHKTLMRLEDHVISCLTQHFTFKMELLVLI